MHIDAVLLAWLFLVGAPEQTSAAAPSVKYLSASEVAKAIREAPAGPLAAVPLAAAQEYRVFGIRRGAVGEAEIHEREIDVWYVIGGRGSLVTGGTMPGAKTTGPGELRSAGIQGGDTREVGPGDVVTIAAGVPHWLSRVEGEMRYLVVKVTVAKP